MELPNEVFVHLSTAPIQLLKDDVSQKSQHDKDLVILDRQQQQQIESGFLVAQYLLRLNQMKQIVNLNTVQLGALKSSHNQTSRLFNWNTVLKEVERIGIKVDADQKSLIVSGDHECIIDLLTQLFEFEKKLLESLKMPPNTTISKKKKQKEGEQPLDIVSLNPNKALNETDSTLEYILISLSQALNLQPKQAAGLLTNQNHYLLHACIKGVKNSFDPILQWYQLMYATSKHLSQLATDAFLIKSFHEESMLQSAYMLLNALKCGFFSENIAVTEWTVKLFTKMAQDLSNLQLEFVQWFIQVPTQKNGQLGGGLEATVYALNHHSQIVEGISLLILSVFRSKYFDKFLQELKKNNQQNYHQILCELLPYLHKQDKEEIIENVMTPILEETLKESLEGNAQQLSLLAEIWSLAPDLIQNSELQIEEGTSLQDTTIKAFKKSCRDSKRGTRVSAMGLMFKLLDEFALIRNNSAPTLYKILTFSLIENIEDEVTREFLMSSFIEVFLNHQSIPVQIIVEPMLRMMQVKEQEYKFNTFDFEFFLSLAKHPKLTAIPFGLQLMDQFAKIYLNATLWAQSASVPFVVLADRFQQEPAITDFLLKFLSITLSTFLYLKKPWELVNKSIAQEIPFQSDLDESTKKLKRYNLVTITKKILNLKISEQFNDQIKQMILQINRKHKQFYGTMNRGLVHLLEFWFNKGKQAMDDYLKQVESEEKKAIEVEGKKQAALARKEEIDRIKAKYYHTNQSDENEEMFENQSDYQQQERALVPWIHKEPKNIKAKVEIEIIRQKREDKVIKQQKEEEKKKQKEERQKKELGEQLKKRKIELGINTKALSSGEESNQMLALYTQTPRKQDQIHAQNAKAIKQILDLETEEEERDRDGVKILLQKYQKPFKFLFTKYAMSRTQHKKVQNFDYYGDKTINLAEVNKLLRDHDITQQMISKEQLQSLIRLLNNKLFKRLDLSALDFNSYLQLIVQIAFFIYCQEGNSFYLSPVEALQRLINHFEKATKSRGQSTLLYEDPDITTIGDQQILKELNRRLKDQPDTLIPEGYYKVTEKEQNFKYVLPDYLEINESQKIAIEVLEEIVWEQMGFHLIEAMVSYESKVKVKPRIKQTLVPQVNAGLQYMKPIERSAKQFNPHNKLPSQLVQQEAQYKKPALSIDLKLALYQSLQSCSPEDRSVITETADVLEEILQTVEKGGTELPEREKIKYTKDFWNKAKEEKKLKEIEERDLEKQREEKRIKRKHELQGDLSKQKEEKQKMLEESKIQKQEQEKETKEQEKIKKEEQKRKYEERKIMNEEVKKQRIVEVQAKKAEEDELKMKEKQFRQKEQKEFLIKQKEKLGQEFEQRKKEKDEAEKAKVEFEEWKKQKQQKVKIQMESYLKENKDQYHQESKEREMIQEFYMQKDVQELFGKYDKALEYLFKFYASQDKKEISFKLNNELKRVNFNEFIKFGYQCYITPTIVPNDDMVLIFRAMIRERRESLSQKEIDEVGTGVNSLAYEDFKKALIRITILGQDLLSSQKGQKLEAKLLEELNNTNNSQKPPLIKAKSRGRSSVAYSSSTTKRKNIQLQKQNSTANIQPTSGNNTTRQQSHTRKTREQKMLEDLQKEKERQEKMLSVKIEDKRMSKPFDVSIITPQTLEGLLKFIQLQPDDNYHKLDKKLNSQRIEIQGQKPNKVKKSLVLNQSMKDLDHQQAQGGHSNDINQIQPVDLEELENSDKLMESIIGPGGAKETWKIDQ